MELGDLAHCSVDYCKKLKHRDWKFFQLSMATVVSLEVSSRFFPMWIEGSRHGWSGVHHADIRYNGASLSKIKQREPPGRRILAAALFVRTCKQWNYPFPVRIYPDDSQPVADLPPGKHV